jgi:hypothetical protein
MAWAWFAVVQLVQLLATVIGWVLLIPFCLTQAWTTRAPVIGDSMFVRSIKDGRVIDRWSFAPLNAVYGNPEDGVSGAHAIIWGNGVEIPLGKQGPYMAGANPIWRAYCWNARNSAASLKYIFAWEAGPYIQVPLFGRTLRAGWQHEIGGKVPVLSLS